MTNSFTSLAGSKRRAVLKRKPYIYFFGCLTCMLVFTGITRAQLSTSGGQTATQLVQNTLLGSGVQLISVTSQGSAGAIGTFNGASSNIGISSGVILTTGTISGNTNGPIGPNNSPSAGLDNGSGGDDPLLGPLIPNNPGTYNATEITFTFIPQGDSINFKYVFGSEEYKEYVGSDFNDVFGFFLTGPNPAVDQPITIKI
jgi:hypothetical protein